MGLCPVGRGSVHCKGSCRFDRFVTDTSGPNPESKPPFNSTNITEPIETRGKVDTNISIRLPVDIANQQPANGGEEAGEGPSSIHLLLKAVRSRTISPAPPTAPEVRYAQTPCSSAVGWRAQEGMARLSR